MKKILTILTFTLLTTIPSRAYGSCSTYYATNLTPKQREKRKIAIETTRATLKSQNTMYKDTFAIYAQLIHFLSDMPRNDMFEKTVQLQQIINQLELEEQSTDTIFLRITAENLKKLIRVGRGKSLSRQRLWALTQDVLEEVHYRQHVAAREHNAALNGIPRKQLDIYRSQQYAY